MKPRIRVLLADDSPGMLSAIASLLGEHEDLEVVGRAHDGAEAVALTMRLRPDIVTMDVLMPGLDGLGATAAIMAEAPSRVLMVCSVSEEQQLDLSFRAIDAGALELIAKPRGGPTELRKWGIKLAESIRLMAEIPVVTRRRLSLATRVPTVSAKGSVDAFGMVASTGGPPALALLLGALPAELPVPILIAQHITFGFTGGLVRWLSAVSPLKVTLAEHGRAFLPGHAYLPPDGKHLEVDEEGLARLTSAEPTGHCPSGDRLLRSLAKAYGRRAGGAVLTGMGDDGAAGLLEIRKSGGQTFAQDANSCVVYGMPQAAIAIKATDLLLPLDAMAGAIRDLCERR